MALLIADRAPKALSLMTAAAIAKLACVASMMLLALSHARDTNQALASSFVAPLVRRPPLYNPRLVLDRRTAKCFRAQENAARLRRGPAPRVGR
jgi:hypothetical protein